MLVSYMCHTFTQAKQQPAIAILVEVKALKTLVFMHELEMDMALGNCMIVLSAICKLQLLQKGGNRGTRQHKGLLWGKVMQLEILIKGRNNPLPRPKGHISGLAVARNSTYCIIFHMQLGFVWDGCYTAGTRGNASSANNNKAQQCAASAATHAHAPRARGHAFRGQTPPPLCRSVQ